MMRNLLCVLAVLFLALAPIAALATPEYQEPSPESFGIPAQPFGGVHCSGATVINPVPAAYGGGQNVTMYQCSGSGVPAGSYCTEYINGSGVVEIQHCGHP